jgi:hypothetical protein
LYITQEHYKKDLKSNPKCISTLTGLGDCYFLEGKYMDAISSYKQALKIDPNNDRALKGTEDAKQSLILISKVTPMLPEGYELIHIAPFINHSSNQIAVLIAKVSKNYPYWGHFGNMTNLRLFVFCETANKYQKVWTSNVLFDATLATLIVHDITHDGKPDIIVCEIKVGGCRTPSHIDIFSTSERGWNKIFGGSSNEEPGVLKDLNGDGKYELLLRNSVCNNLCHTEQPRWLSIFAYDGINYSLANNLFPEEFRELHQYMLSLIKKHPDNAELFYYIGQIYELFCDDKNALDTYRKSESLFSKQIDKYYFNRSILVEKKKFIKQRIEFLVQSR